MSALANDFSCDELEGAVAENGTSLRTTLVIRMGATGISGKLWPLCGKHEIQHTREE